MVKIDINAVRHYCLGLQEAICRSLERHDGSGKFMADSWQRANGGDGISCVLNQGHIIEKGGINFSHIMGDAMPAAATTQRPELVGRRFQAMGVSAVLHPRNPYIPTSHLNVRFFVAEKEGVSPVWWFGGGYDLTPYYGNEIDCRHWHQVAKGACDPFGENLYPHFKQRCDEYFFLPHRQEARGVGGLFFDDLNSPDFATAFAIMQSVGNSYMQAYGPIIERRKHTEYGEQERDFQLHRRGRYVEFNLIYDRGTLFGLQSGGRTEAILMSLPPQVSWDYDLQPTAGTPEAELTEKYLPIRDWLA